MFTTPKGGRPDGFSPSSERTADSFRLSHFEADFVGCHQLQFIDKYQMAERLKHGGIFLLNTPYSADEVWSRLPQEVQAVLNQKKARFYVINAAKIARRCGTAARINTVMQMAFFHLTQILRR